MVDGSALNVSVIQTYDEYCIELLDKSSSAHVYTFNPTSNSWVKSKIGGVFFLYKRSKSPFSSFMILNRKSPSLNQIEHINPGLQLQLHSQFLLYKTVNGGIYSIWFFSEHDCARIGERIGKMVQELGGSGLLTPKKNEPVAHSGSAHTESASDSLNQLMNMIRGSVDSAATQTQSTTESILLDGNKRKNVIGNPRSGSLKSQQKPLKSQPSSGPKAVAAAAPNLLAMLHKAEADFNSEGVKTAATDTNLDHGLQQLRLACNITSSSTATKTQKIPNESPIQAVSSGFSRSGGHLSVAELEQRLLRDAQALPPTLSDSTGSTSPEEKIKAPLSFDLPPKPSKSGFNKPTRLLSDLDAGYADDVDETYEDETDNTTQAHSTGISHHKSRRHPRTHQQEQLSSERSSKWTVVSRTPVSGLVANDSFLDQDDELLVTPAMLCSLPTVPRPVTDPCVTPKDVSCHTSDLEPRTNEVDGLTKTQLRDALIHILQKDDDFLHQIHAAYMSSLQSRISKL